MEGKTLKIGKGSPEKFKAINEQFNLKGESFHIFAGPCAIESEKALEKIAEKLSHLGIKFLRGGAFKPRTSPYDFQGLGEEGLEILSAVGKKYGMFTVSEVVDTRHVEKAVDYVDILQVGSRNMYNFELLKEVGRSRHPVILKRGMCATTKEFEFAAEYIACEGNRSIIMCERGVRTFENATRNTLDISCAAILKQETKLPVIVDLSHSLGRKDIINRVAKAVAALGADGIMVEVHPSPLDALSDSFQQLDFGEFEGLISSLGIGKNN